LPLPAQRFLERKASKEHDNRAQAPLKLKPCVRHGAYTSSNQAATSRPSRGFALPFCNASQAGQGRVSFFAAV